MDSPNSTEHDFERLSRLALECSRLDVAAEQSFADEQLGSDVFFDEADWAIIQPNIDVTSSRKVA